MEKNAWYVNAQIVDRLDDTLVLSDYITSRASEKESDHFSSTKIF